MDNKNNPDFGRVMNDALQDALHTGDFSGLRQTVSTTLKSVVGKTIECAKDVRDDASYLFDWDKKPKTPPPGWGPCAWNPGRVWEPEQSAPKPPTPPEPPTPPRQAEPPRQAPPPPRPKPKAAGQAQPQAAQTSDAFPAPPYLKKTKHDLTVGVLLVILGCILMLPSILYLMFFWLLLFVSNMGAFELALAILMLALMLPGVIVLRKGVQKYGWAKRFRSYWEFSRKKGYCEIAALANMMERKPKFVVKDLTRMLNKGLFPGGHLDDEKTCLILREELYQQYLAAKEGKKRREQPPSAENAVIAAGMEAVRQIRAANAALPGVIISEKLLRLEEVTAGIFAYVEQRPAKLTEIRRFIDYYLPTTLKLVKSYQEFESQPETASTAAAKEEILATLDTISSAFEALLDGLYQDDTMDVSTDISVLKTMLAQEGLTGSDFEKKRSADHE